MQSALQGVAGSGGSVVQHLQTLRAYWSSTIDLIQRQEHGATKEGVPLEWEDARLVVFSTMVSMAELDRAVLRFRSE